MIHVGMFHKSQMAGTPVAILSYSGRGKTVHIETSNSETKAIVEVLVKTKLSLPANSVAYPETRQYWMESLPRANHSISYWFKIMEEQISVEEEDTDDNEEIIDENEADEEAPSDEPEDEGNGDGGDSGASADAGGDSSGDILTPNG